MQAYKLSLESLKSDLEKLKKNKHKSESSEDELIKFKKEKKIKFEKNFSVFDIPI